MATRPGAGRPSLAIDHQRVERQKQLRRDLWEYRLPGRVERRHSQGLPHIVGVDDAATEG